MKQVIQFTASSDDDDDDDEEHQIKVHIAFTKTLHWPRRNFSENY